jgi:hypothetical protein
MADAPNLPIDDSILTNLYCIKDEVCRVTVGVPMSCCGALPMCHQPQWRCRLRSAHIPHTPMTPQSITVILQGYQGASTHSLFVYICKFELSSPTSVDLLYGALVHG